MPENGRCPVVHFDHNSQEHSADPVASYRKLRETSPIAYTEAWGDYFGSFKDRFGVMWMVDYTPPREQ